MENPVLALANGYHDLPPGKLASIVTYLELATPPATPGEPRSGLRLERLGPAQAGRYAALFRRIGERWMWVSRLTTPQPEIAAILGMPGIEAYALVTADGRDEGLLELDARAPDETEIVYFAVTEALIGTGAGRWLMREAQALAFARPIRRLWLHTCTLDHPGAVAFYRKAGFRPTRLAVEIIDDPRATGALPAGSFPDLPLTARA